MSTIKATMTTAAMATMATVDAATITRPFLSCRLLAKPRARAPRGRCRRRRRQPRLAEVARYVRGGSVRCSPPRSVLIAAVLRKLPPALARMRPLAHRSAVSTRKGGGFYGYRVHAAVCSRTGLPLAWEVKTAREHESMSVAPLLNTLHARGFRPETAALDKGYDNTRVYAECEERGCAPIIPLRQTPDVKRGQHGPPECEHGVWTFAGADFKRHRPSGAALPASARPPRHGSAPTGGTR
jgi:hypothetical protein